MTDKERREWYLSHGICPHCGRNDVQAGHKLCLECRTAQNERRRGKEQTAEQLVTLLNATDYERFERFVEYKLNRQMNGIKSEDNV